MIKAETCLNSEAKQNAAPEVCLQGICLKELGEEHLPLLDTASADMLKVVADNHQIIGDGYVANMVLIKLITQDDASVRLHLARNPDTKPLYLEFLLEDSDNEVVAAAQANTWTDKHPIICM